MVTSVRPNGGTGYFGVPLDGMFQRRQAPTEEQERRHPVRCACGWSGRRRALWMAKPCPGCRRAITAVPNHREKTRAIRITVHIDQDDLAVVSPEGPSGYRDAIRAAVRSAVRAYRGASP